ncbi:uncharacterized protein GGS22DRAFT_183427 [Annulohypoxylon maeteangense]|uniref:uncharacterized protein n=1 Tax=Annulohypoxylon maeteangense TaxID=1927788 RepID=UPI002007890A|nr:uncharacterized protein GGS22DRAFT_183427 [Annulohypoxylon maeteangense]KAI0890076.1 hypothetical protein GGS22DRAFT_183427 [Annulohypoxylon maeteangense]
MPPKVEVYTTPPPALEKLLRSHHLPHALPLLRRLRFTRFPGGITEHTRILYASASGAELGDDTPGDEPFAAAYLDFSRGPETEIWLYASLERRPDALARAASSVGRETRTDDEESREEASATCARLVLREVKRLRDLYSAARAQVSHVFAGALSETLRLALLNQGIVFEFVSIFDKWIFRLQDLPAVRDPLGEGMEWGPVRRKDIPLMLSRTKIPRTERTVMLLPSMAVYRDDGTPIAWAFLGPDSSLSSLHCEEEWRGKGFAKAVAVNIFRERLKDFDDDGHCWANVAPDNPKSQRVCKSLGGKVAWAVSWSRIDLDKSFPDQ